MPNINNLNINYLYDAQGQTMAVKKGSDEESVISDGTSVEYNGEEWITLDPDYNLDDACTVQDLDLDQLTSLFTNGNLTKDELYNGLSAKEGFDENSYEVTEDGEWTTVNFTVNEDKYSINCLTEECEYQTDGINDMSSQQAAARSVGNDDKTGTQVPPSDSERMILLSRGIPESVIDSGVYSVDELMELSQTPGTELYEQCYGMDASWSDEEMQYMGFDIDYYKSTYFDQNSDGTYSLKKAATKDGKDGLYVEDEFISDLQGLKEKLGVISLEDYFNQLPINAGGAAPKDMIHEYGFLNDCYFGVDEYENLVAQMEKKAGKSLSQAEIVFSWLNEKQNSTKGYDNYKAECFMNSRLEIVKEKNITQSMMYDNPYLNLNFGNVTADFGSTMYYGNHAYSYTEAQDFFSNVVLNLENDDPGNGTFNNTVWNAMLEAAGVTDNDDIQTRAGKISNYVGDTDYLELFDNLMVQGLLEQNTYSEEELHQLYTDEEIEQNFYMATDVSGNSLGVYKLKRGSEIEYINYTSPRLEQGKPTHGVTIAQANMQGYAVVSNAQELMEALNANSKANVVLSGDIDMSGVDNWIPVGTAENPFMGTIYGNGYTISNLNVGSNNQYAGLFGVFAGYAYDITMENCTVKDARGNEVPGNGGTGVLAGKITAQDGKRGGNCSNIQIVNSNVYGRDNAGLLAGVAEPGESYDYVYHTDGIGYPGGIDNCSTSGYVYSQYAAGGLFGKYDGKYEGGIVTCKADADINGQVWAGGLTGQAENSYLLNKGITYNFGGSSFHGKKVMSAFQGCEYTGEINKDIKNPPGALGAGATAGQMTISDKVYNAIEDLENELRRQYQDNESFIDTAFNSRTLMDFGPEFKINGNIYDSDTWTSNGMMYNTYASGRQVGWVCTLNEDGSVKESQNVPGNRYKQGNSYTGAYLVGKTADSEPMSTEEWEYITENYKKYRESNNFEPLEKYRATNAVASAVGFISNPAAPPADNTGFATEAAQEEAIAADQEQYITDPTYIDVVKDVILQNFVEFYDIDNPDEQLIWDQLGSGEYVTRANYKEMIDRVKERTGLTDDELIQRTLEKLLNECTDMNPKETGANSGIDIDNALRQDCWLVSLVAAMGGTTSRITDENNGCLPHESRNGEIVEGYVPKSEPGQMYFNFDGYNYIISFDSEVPPEFISADELNESLKNSGASSDEIQNVIKYYFNDAVSKQSVGNGEKEVLEYYFSPQKASNGHLIYGSLFKGIDDVVNFFTGNDDEYSHYWNTCVMDDNYRNEVIKFRDTEANPYGGEIIDNVLSDDEYKIYPGLYVFKEYERDKDGKKIYDKETKRYKSSTSLIIWDPDKETFVKTGIGINELYDQNGKVNWEYIRSNCNDAHILKLLEAYIRRKAPTSAI